MSTPVSTQYLLEGAVYSIEHCGQLLRDAILLYRNDSYATAVAVACSLARSWDNGTYCSISDGRSLTEQYSRSTMYESDAMSMWSSNRRE
jgi:hypothetical protein